MADMKFSLLLKADGASNVTGQLKQVETAVKGVDGQTKKLTDSQQKATSSVKEMSAAFSSLQGALAGLGLAVMVKQFVSLYDEIIFFQRGLKAVSGSTTAVAENMIFVTNLAARLGININQLRQTFISFAGAVKGTALEGEPMRRIMEAMATQGKNLGLSAEAMNRAFVAVSQMASKGVVSMEELRQQLAEAMPGALQLMASAMGKTLPEFSKMVESGNVLASDILPKWAAAMEKLNASMATGTEGFKTFNEAITATTNELQLLIESGALKETTTGGDWKAVITGYLEAINQINSYLKALRIRSEFEKSMEGQLAAEIANRKALTKTLHDQIRAYSTEKEQLQKTRDALAESERAIERLRGQIEAVKNPLQDFVSGLVEAEKRGAALAKTFNQIDLASKWREAISGAANVGAMAYDFSAGGLESIAKVMLPNIKAGAMETFKRFAPIIVGEAQRLGLDAGLALAVAFQEGAGFGQGGGVRGGSGEYGLMQVMPFHFSKAELAGFADFATDVADQELAAIRGVQVLGDALVEAAKKAGGDINYALEVYNKGAGGAAKAIKGINVGGDPQYVEHVMAFYNRLMSKDSAVRDQLSKPIELRVVMPEASLQAQEEMQKAAEKTAAAVSKAQQELAEAAKGVVMTSLPLDAQKEWASTEKLMSLTVETADRWITSLAAQGKETTAAVAAKEKFIEAQQNLNKALAAGTLNKAKAETEAYQKELAGVTTGIIRLYQEQAQSVAILRDNEAVQRGLTLAMSDQSGELQHQIDLAGKEAEAQSRLGLERKKQEALTTVSSVNRAQVIKDYDALLAKMPALAAEEAKYNAAAKLSSQADVNAWEIRRKAIQEEEQARISNRLAVAASAEEMKREQISLETANRMTQELVKTKEKEAAIREWVTRKIESEWAARAQASYQREIEGLKDEQAQLTMTAEAYRQYIAQKRVFQQGWSKEMAREEAALKRINEGIQLRQGWANSVLEGFDQLWSNMISGAENAMDALKKTLKSWLYAIGQWLLKQAIIIPITAKMFNVSEKSLGGGLLGAIAGNQGGASEVVGLLTDLRGESQKTAENTGNTVLGLGGVTNTFGSLISGLAGGLWQFLAAILTALTTGNLAKAGESMTKAGSSLMDGMSGIKSFFTGGGLAKSLNSILGKVGLFGASGHQQTALFGGANWGYGLAGAAGYFGAGALYGNKGYSGMGGSLGAMAGYGLTAAGSTFGAAAVSAITAGLGGGAMAGAIAGSVVPVIGTILGAVAGGALGSLFGNKEKIKGGVGYYDFNRRAAGAAHKDTDPAVVEMLGKLGKTMEGLDSALRGIQGFGDMWNFGASFQLDTDTAGRVEAAYNSYARGLQKASFKAADDAAKWFVEQMVLDVKKQFELHGRDIGGLGDAITRAMQSMNADQIEPFLNMLATSLPPALSALMKMSEPLQKTIVGMTQNLDTAGLQQFMEELAQTGGIIQESFSRLPAALQTEVEAMAATYARSMDDIIAITLMAVDANTSYADSIDSVFTGIRAIRDANEKLTDAYSRGMAQFKEWQMAAALLGGKYVSGAMALNADMIYWANQVTEAAGGLEALQSLQQNYFENFYTDEERAEAARKVARQSVDAFNRSIGRAGQSAIDTRNELRAYIQSLDTTTDAGRKAYIAALRLADAIMTLDSAAEAATGMDELVNSLQAYTKQQLKPGTDTQSQSASFFENFYTEEERAAAATAEWTRQIAEFNASLGLSGNAAIDTTAEFRSYIESLDMTTEAGREAYTAAMKLVAAILGIKEAAQGAADKTLSDVFDEIFDTGSVRSLVQKYMEAIQSARELGATAEEVWAIAMQGLTELKLAAQSFAQSVGTISVDEFVIKARQMILAAFDFGGFDVAIRYAEELERALQEAIQAAIWKVVELKKAWEDFQIAMADRLGKLNNGPGVSPDTIAQSYYRMLNTFIAAWKDMDLEQQLSAVNTMLGYIDQWVSASIAHINDALSKQVDAINAAADAQLAAINDTTDALQDYRNEVAESYSEQIDALQEILDGLGDWVNVIESLKATMKSLQYGGQNPIPPGAQMAAMGEEIAKKMAEFRLAPTADLAEEIRALLEQRIGIASQVFQRTDSRYIALYAQTMELLREILAAAPDESGRIEDIQKEIKELTKEQNEVLKDLDKQIEAQRKAVEDQTKAINAARDAQIRAAEAAAESQRRAIYDTARILYEQYQAIGNDIYRQMVEQGLRDIDIAKRTLNATHNMILALVELYNVVAGTQWRPEDHAWRQYQGGTPYVPETGPAILHQGERVLTVEENKAYGSGGKPIVIQIHLFENSHISGDPVVIRKTVQDMIPVIKREIKRTL